MTSIEQDRLARLAWGKYESRSTFAVTMVAVGLILWGGMPQALALVPWSQGPAGEFLFVLPVLLVAAGWVVLPTDPARRRVAGALVSGVMVLEYGAWKIPAMGALTGGLLGPCSLRSLPGRSWPRGSSFASCLLGRCGSPGP